jgi:hypothetical protein
MNCGKNAYRGIRDCTRERTRCSCAAHDETQETEFVRAVNAHAHRLRNSPVAGGPREPWSARQVRRAYFGGLLSGGGDAGGVELMAPFGLLESDDDGGIVVVVPGEVD